ncbi:MAG: WXG100 family type VII secretion target [Mycetocola sp.]
MVQFSVSTDAVGGASAALTTMLAEFDAQLASADAAVSGVATASWQGDAATEFLSAWEQFHSIADETRLALQSIAVRLSGGQSTYETTERGQVNASESQTIVGTAPLLAGSGSQSDAAEQSPVAPAAAEATPADGTGGTPTLLASVEGAPLLANLREGISALGGSQA